jgi:membrane protease YdiL (CAAX protease family)
VANRFAELHPRRFFLETWRAVDAEAAAERSERGEPSSYDYRPLIALAVGAVCLTVMEYFGVSAQFIKLVDRAAAGESGTSWTELAWELRDSKFYRLIQYVWWAGFRVLGYFIVPALTVKLVFRENLREYGLRTQGFSEHAWIYGLFYCVVLVCVVGVSFTPEFSSYYPFYKSANRSWLDFGAWELLYAAQFFSLEFFFRGFWLKACKSSMGSHAIFAAVVPYCMIHYGKPWLEALGAIIAGIVLGTLALKTRSIWSGFLIHVSVAISMDTAALLQTQGLPTEWLPK